jgi:endonuclease YncB( thermonuclease family)
VIRSGRPSTSIAIRQTPRRSCRWGLGLVLVAFGAIGAIRDDATPTLAGRVLRVIDGDSLQVQLSSGPMEVRLHAVDTPEYNQPGGREAARALGQRLPRGTAVFIEPVEQDRYARMVAVVYLGDENVNLWLVAQGHAWVYRQYTSERDYCVLEDEARTARRGLWSRPAPDWVAPWDWRRRQRDGSFNPPARAAETLATCLQALRRAPRPAGAPASVPHSTPAPVQGAGCRIKGNIGSSGNRIYHVPGSSSYNATRIDTAKGERWFCSEAEARAAGWRGPSG